MAMLASVRIITVQYFKKFFFKKIVSNLKKSLHFINYFQKKFQYQICKWQLFNLKKNMSI